MGEKLIVALFEHKIILEELGYEIDSKIIDLLKKDGRIL